MQVGVSYDLLHHCTDELFQLKEYVAWFILVIKSQTFFSSKIKTINIAETLRKVDPLKGSANALRTECEGFDFCLDGNFNSTEDATLS